MCIPSYTVHTSDGINDCYHCRSAIFIGQISIWICWFCYILMHVHRVHVQCKCSIGNKHLNLHSWQMIIFSLRLNWLDPTYAIVIRIQINPRRDSIIMSWYMSFFVRKGAQKEFEFITIEAAEWLPKSIQSKQNATIARHEIFCVISFFIRLMCLKSIRISMV